MNNELVTAVLGGGAAAHIVNAVLAHFRGSKKDATELMLKAQTQLREEQAEWRGALRMELESVRKQLRQVEDENASLRGKIAELEARNVDLHEDNERLQGRVQELENELSALKHPVVVGL